MTCCWHISSSINLLCLSLEEPRGNQLWHRGEHANSSGPNFQPRRFLLWGNHCSTVPPKCLHGFLCNLRCSYVAATLEVHLHSISITTTNAMFLVCFLHEKHWHLKLKLNMQLASSKKKILVLALRKTLTIQTLMEMERKKKQVSSLHRGVFSGFRCTAGTASET